LLGGEGEKREEAGEGGGEEGGLGAVVHGGLLSGWGFRVHGGLGGSLWGAGVSGRKAVVGGPEQ
jgi:hypothetical protein